MTITTAILLALDGAIIVGTILIISAILRVRDVPPTIATREAIRALIAKAYGALPSGSVFYDLGSGVGDMVIAMAKEHPNVRCVGIEKYLIPLWIARFRAWRKGLRNAFFIQGDIFDKEAYRDATHLYTYLYPETMGKLVPKLEGKELVVYSLDFLFPNHTPVTTTLLPNPEKKLGSTLYRYEFHRDAPVV